MFRFILTLCVTLLVQSVYAQTEQELIEKISYPWEDPVGNEIRFPEVFEPDELPAVWEDYASKEDFLDHLFKMCKSKKFERSDLAFDFLEIHFKYLDLTEKQIQQLILWAKSSRETLAMGAIRCLCAGRVKSAIPTLRECLKSRKANIVAEALKALGEMRDLLAEDDITAIVSCLDNTKVFENYVLVDFCEMTPVNVRAAEVLARIGEPAAFAHERIFKTFFTPDEDGNYNEAVFDELSKTLSQSDVTIQDFWRQMLKIGIHPLERGVSTLYLRIAKALVKLQPDNKQYQILLLQHYVIALDEEGSDQYSNLRIHQNIHGAKDVKCMEPFLLFVEKHKEILWPED